MRNASWLMASLRFLELHQEALEFRCVRVWIKDRRREQIRQRHGVLALVLLDAAVTLMNGDADLVDLLAVDRHWLDALRDHSFRDVLSADARYFYLLAADDSHLLRHFRGNFYERLGDQLHVHGIVFCPVVIKLGQAIRGAYDGVTVFRSGVFVVRGLVALHHRIVGLLRMKRVVDRTLDRFVMFGERSIRERA